jgi:hypothetical protein
MVCQSCHSQGCADLLTSPAWPAHRSSRRRRCPASAATGTPPPALIIALSTAVAELTPRLPASPPASACRASGRSAGCASDPLQVRRATAVRVITPPSCRRPPHQPCEPVWPQPDLAAMPPTSTHSTSSCTIRACSTANNSSRSGSCRSAFCASECTSLRNAARGYVHGTRSRSPAPSAALGRGCQEKEPAGGDAGSCTDRSGEFPSLPLCKV